MRYYWLNREDILQKAKESYSKEKAAEYYLKNKESIKEKQKLNTKTCHKKKKTRFNPIQDGLFGGWAFCHPHLSYINETWHTYTLPKEDQKNV